MFKMLSEAIEWKQGKAKRGNKVLMKHVRHQNKQQIVSGMFKHAYLQALSNGSLHTQ